MSTYYRLNEPDVSAETFDDEVLAINLSNGHYFSMRGSGAVIWKLLMAGHSAEDVARGLRQMYPGAVADVEAEVAAFVTALAGAGLVVAEAPAPREAAPGLEISPSLQPYATPVYESHTDMEDLLMIDPIHDVDVKLGWPMLSESGAGKVA